jgi:hypothetical protein
MTEFTREFGVAPERKEPEEGSYAYELEDVKDRIGRPLTPEEEKRFFETDEVPGEQE